MPDGESDVRPRRGVRIWRVLVALLVALPLIVSLTGPSGAAVAPDPTATSVPTTDPAPADPAPTDPSPPAPAPSDPAPTAPAPSNPAPSNPAPSNPPSHTVPAPSSNSPAQSTRPTPSPATTVRSTSPRTTVAPGSGTGTGQETEPTAGDLMLQQDALHTLDLRIASARDAVTRAQAELERAAMVAGRAIEVYSSAIKALQAAQLEDQRQQDLLTQAQASLTGSQHLLGRWVRQAYRDGTDVGGDLGLVSLLGAGSTDDLGTTRQFLRRVGDARSRTVTEVEQALAVQASAAGRAQAAAEAAAAAALEADAAKSAADAAVQQQRDTLARLEQALAQSTADAAAQRAQLSIARADFEAALRLSAPPAGRSASSGDNTVTGTVGACAGGAVQNYSNGRIPLAVLCPLVADPRHHLRADAAFAFDRLSRAYVAHFGARPCITDSYRSLEAQFRVFAAKPNLAARPGTSNHGWGTALDLCGGIQSFDSEQHLWLLVNAPLYGWFHPAWAQRGGSKPEPWHWEFGG